MSDDDQTYSNAEWQTRLKQVQKDNLALFGFVRDAEANGVISKDASRTYFRAANAVMSRAGIIEGQLSGNPHSPAVVATTVAQAQHEGKQALLALHPELAEQLEKIAPSKGRPR